VKEPTLADALACPTKVPAQFRITPDQRLYYNYTHHQPSRDAGTAGVGHNYPDRDFRSMREKERDPEGA